MGNDATSFAEALRSAMRQDADVILVGELRDLETISLALQAAEMGALVLATLHTSGAAKTVDRIIDVFPGGEQPRIRLSLGDALAAVVSQLLIPTADGKGRVAATEILFRCQGLANAIREGATPMIRNLIQSGRRAGMRSMDDSLLELLAQKRITLDEALRKATEKQRFESRSARLSLILRRFGTVGVDAPHDAACDRGAAQPSESTEMPQRGKSKKSVAKKSSAKKTAKKSVEPAAARSAAKPAAAKAKPAKRGEGEVRSSERATESARSAAAARRAGFRAGWRSTSTAT